MIIEPLFSKCTSYKIKQHHCCGACKRYIIQVKLADLYYKYQNAMFACGYKFFSMDIGTLSTQGQRDVL